MTKVIGRTVSLSCLEKSGSLLPLRLTIMNCIVIWTRYVPFVFFFQLYRNLVDPLHKPFRRVQLRLLLRGALRQSKALMIYGPSPYLTLPHWTKIVSGRITQRKDYTLWKPYSRTASQCMDENGVRPIWFCN